MRGQNQAGRVNDKQELKLHMKKAKGTQANLYDDLTEQELNATSS